MCLLFSAFQALGQPYYFRHYQVENGLSHNTVTCSIQDHEGFLWFATKGGINRFDGYHFKIVSYSKLDPKSLGTNRVICMLEVDSLIWLGTDRGLYSLNKKTSRSIPVPALARSQIRCIVRSKAGHLWLLADGRLMDYNPSIGRLTSYSSHQDFYGTSLALGSDDKVWVASSRGTLERLGVRSTFDSFDLFKHSPAVQARDIETIFAADSGLLFVGTAQQGFKSFDSRLMSYSDLLPKNSDNTSIFVHSFMKANSGEYWIATESGIYIYHKGSGLFENVQRSYNDRYSLSDNAVYSLTQDREGGIWACTYFGGLNYTPHPYTLFTKYYPGSGQNRLKGNVVREICRDNYRNLWVGTEDNGLNKLNLDTHKWTQYLPGGNGSISSFNIHGLLPDGKTLFIGTFKHGLDIMDIPSGHVVRHYLPTGRQGSLNCNFVLNISKLSSGKILLATAQGTYWYSKETDSFSLLATMPAQAFVHTITVDYMGTVWLGTWNDGIYRLNQNTGLAQRFISPDSRLRQLDATLINGIFEDSKHWLWISTDGLGLWKYNPSRGELYIFDLDNGLPSNYVYRTLEDHSGKFWITTSRGLVSLDSQNNGLTTFTTAAGLLSDQFNYNSGYMDSDGTLYFGCVKGMISFNPATFTVNNYRAPIYITGFQQGNSELSTNIRRDSTSMSAELVDVTANMPPIDLSENQNSFSIDFAALSFTAPQMTKYRFMMQGLDTTWNLLKTNRRVYYTGLSPGTYTFRVSSSTNGLWDSPEARLIIRIAPPWWESRVALCIYLIIAGLTALLLIERFKKRQLAGHRRMVEILENAKEIELYQAKIEFFTNVAHEIRTPLTLIKGPMEKIMKLASEVPVIAGNLSIMERNTNRLLDLANQLLDFRNTERSEFSLSFVRTNVSELVTDIFTSFRPMAEMNGIEYELNMPPEILFAYVDKEVFRKITSNILNNALKYSNSFVTVKLSLPSDDSCLLLSVGNDGFIIPEELQEKIFEPFYRIRETEKVAGTGIGLALARSLAELHKGSLFLKKGDGTLNVFILSLPLHQEHEFSTLPFSKRIHYN